MPDDTFTHDVFLSHSSKDKGRVPLPSSSTASLASGWVALERSTAVHHDPAHAGRRFIPLMPGDCALPDALRRCKAVDYREESDATLAEVPATLCDTLPPKLLSGELSTPQTNTTRL